VVYALCQRGWPAALRRLDTIVQRAAAHTFGIFLAHYALYWALDRAGVRGTVPGPAAVAVAATVTVALCLAASHIPPLPWSPRTGRRRPMSPDPRRGCPNTRPSARCA
jgi:hypothetical protein